MAQGAERITPYAGDNREKGEQVREMFDSIAPAYDFMNRAMTLGIDRIWRRRVVKMVARAGAVDVLDIASGTGDLAIDMAHHIPGARVTGVDLSEGMIAIGREKVVRAGLDTRVKLGVADCLSLPFADASFDAVTVAFGVRNFQELLRGYAEMLRVLRPGGLLVVLELSTPESKYVLPFYNFYTRRVIPFVGRMVSHDADAYRYLPDSIRAVARGNEMCALVRQAGFKTPTYRTLTFGVATIYSATK